MKSPLHPMWRRAVRGEANAPAIAPTPSFHGFEIVRGRLPAPLIGDEIEAQLLALVQLAEAGALDGSDVDEGVLAAVILRDEAEAPLGVEPFDGSRCHEFLVSQALARPATSAGGRI